MKKKNKPQAVKSSLPLSAECFDSDGRFALVDSDGRDIFYSVIAPAEDGDHPNHDPARLARTAALIVLAANAHAGRTSLLRAIAARIDGAFDDPDLMAMGELHADAEEDIAGWVRAALRAAGEEI